MGIPDYQTIMLPLLRFLSDQKEKTARETQKTLADEFELTGEERRELQPSGQQPLFANRVGWAKTYLQKAGLITSPKRAVYKITDRGLDVLNKKPAQIDKEYLMQFPEFVDFVSVKKSTTSSPVIAPVIEINKESEKTPEDHIEYGYQAIYEELSSEILNIVKDCSPDFFEKLVIDLLVKMGYGGSRKEAGKKLGKSGDEGIDGVINEDKLGLDAIYIQAKRWNGVVGRPEIQKFAGALQGQRARKGIFITTSGFTKESIDYVSKIDNKIVLIDGPQLSALMIDHGVGVSTIASYDLKRIDTDYFSEE